MTDIIICNGRRIDEAGIPYGEPCGYKPPKFRSDIQQLRAGGWRIGPKRNDGSRDVMCPRCARPDPELQRLLRELERRP